MRDKNEIIAEWLGAKVTWGGPSVPEDGTLCFTENYTPMVFRHKVYPGFGHAWVDWEPDTDITLWHGEDGLLAEIERREKRVEFLGAFLDGHPECVKYPLGESALWLWHCLNAKPAHLTTALCKMIKAES